MQATSILKITVCSFDIDQCYSSAFKQIPVGEHKKESNNGYKINDVSCIDNSSADATVMKIYSEHFYVIISACFKRRELAYRVESAVHNKTHKCTCDKCHHRVISETATANSN